MIERKEFLNPNRCVIASLFSGQTIDELIEKSQKSKAEGADCITIELRELQPKFRNLPCFIQLLANIDLR